MPLHLNQLPCQTLTRFRTGLVLLALALFQTASAGTHSSLTGSGVSMDLNSVFDGVNPYTGYIPFKLTVKNDNPFAGTWTVSLSTSRSNVRQSVQCHLSVPANSTDTFWLYAPVPCNGWTGQDYSRTTQCSVNVAGTGINGADGQLSEVSYDPFSVDGVKSVTSSPFTAPAAGETSCPLADFPEDWQGYMGLRQVYMPLDDWKGLNKTQHIAILQWVGVGGCLNLDGKTTDRLNELDLGPGIANQLHLTGSANYGGGYVTLGVDKSTSAGYWMSTFPTSFTWSWYSEINPFVIPKVTLLTILIVFIVLAGPVNIVYLAPQERRLRLFITVPVIALSTSLFLFLGIIFGDGFGGTGKRFLVIYSLPSIHSEAVWEEEVSRTELLPANAWQNPDHAFVLKNNFDTSNRPFLTQTNLNQDGALMTGDWYNNRSVQVLFLQDVRPSRSELILKPEQQLQSSFPVDLKVVHFCHRGSYYRCEELHIGEIKTYVPETEEDFKTFFKTAFLDGDSAIAPSEDNSDFFCALPATVPDSLVLHSFSSVRWDTTEAVYMGQFDDQSGANP